MNSSDLKKEAYFTTNGKDVWELESYYLVPSCTMVNLKTGDRMNFGMGALTAASFKKIEMPKGE